MNTRPFKYAFLLLSLDSFYVSTFSLNKSIKEESILSYTNRKENENNTGSISQNQTTLIIKITKQERYSTHTLLARKLRNVATTTIAKTTEKNKILKNTNSLSGKNNTRFNLV